MKILNFGSLNLDHVYNVEHFVRPGETILSDKLDYFCGGKGLNQSIALAKAGANIFHAGKIGHDGLILKETLEKYNVNTDYVSISDERTGHAIIQVDSKGQNCIILYGGANQTITPDYIDSVLDHFDEGDIILLQNEISSIPYIIDKAFSKKIKIAFNPSPFKEELLTYNLQNISWFLINEIEGKEMTGETEPEKICAAMLNQYPNAATVLTLGSKGVMYRDKHQYAVHGVYDVPIVDTTAAGDTFTGYFLASITQGMSVIDALKCASIASALAITVKGAANSIPYAEDVEKSYDVLIPRS